ncbi:MAG: S8 family serine peptidase [Anaerolineales bacterium]|nr:S8 family serine peptidase [Anaerolineales bacterium]
MQKFLHSHKIPLSVLLLIAIISLFTWNAAAQSHIEKTALWQNKIDPQVLTAAASGETDFLIVLEEQADLSGAQALTTRQEKGEYVFQQLTATASRSQTSLIKSLKQQNARYRSFWVVNMVWVRGDRTTLQSAASRSEVAHIYPDPYIQNDLEEIGNSAPAASPAGIEWNISLVNAPQVWAAGYTGQNVVIGGQDTGYQWDHPAIKNQYRGWNGATADHNYNWHDAIHEHISGENVCGLDSVVPCDDNSHGTHTMGTMVGDDGGSNQIGVAPGAQWIGCRNMEEGVGRPSTYIECFEWFIAPYPIGGDPIEDADSSKAPDVINNSWSCPPKEGCSWDTLQTVVNNTRAAGIMVVGSAGNNGLEGCSSIYNPIAIYDSTFSIGATDSSDDIAGFSSRGPSAYTGLLKPDVSAPGDNVRSSVPGNSYTTKDGTSMAAPHVAGMVALLISANPGLAGQVDTLEGIITQSAVPRTTTQECGGVPGSSIPNNTYGWGRIDAYAALQHHNFYVNKTVSNTTIQPGDLLTYTLSIAHSPSTFSTTGVVITDVIPEHANFISASTPYSLSNGEIRWEIASLGANESRQFQLLVQPPITYTGYIINSDYGVKSDDSPTPILGEPVIVLSGKYKFYLPLIFQP